MVVDSRVSDRGHLVVDSMVSDKSRKVEENMVCTRVDNTVLDKSWKVVDTSSPHRDRKVEDCMVEDNISVEVVHKVFHNVADSRPCCLVCTVEECTAHSMAHKVVDSIFLSISLFFGLNLLTVFHSHSKFEVEYTVALETV